MKEMNNYKTYDTYKPSGVEWLGDIPAHWKIKRGTYVFKIINERSKKGQEELLSVSEHHGVRPRSVSNVNMFMAESYEGYKLCYPGDLVINSLWAWSRGLGFSKYNGIVSTAYSVYRPDHINYDVTYLNYLLRIENYVAQYLIASRGIWISRLLLSDWSFLRLPILTPSKEEQTRIANFLDEKTALIEKGIEIKQKQIELLKERRQILIHNAVTRGLNPHVKMKASGVEWIGEIPEHWEVKRLKYITKLISIKGNSKSSPLTYIGMESIESWTSNYIETIIETDGLASYFNTGDVLFGKLRPYLAKVYLAKTEGICSTEFLIYRAENNIYNWYLKLMMLSFKFINLIDSSTYGSKMPRANSDFIGNQCIPLPPKSEQVAISEHIETMSSKISTAITFKEREIERLKEYKATMINSVVTGKVKI
ncbi:MAG: restriction endonuclease subunit S [Prevotella sp.]